MTNRRPWEYGRTGAAIFDGWPKVDIFRAYVADVLTRVEGDFDTDEERLDAALTYVAQRCSEEHKHL